MKGTFNNNKLDVYLFYEKNLQNDLCMLGFCSPPSYCTPIFKLLIIALLVEGGYICYSI